MTEQEQHDYEKLIGLQLRSLRESRGLSQREVAEAMAALGAAYSRWRQSTVDKTEKALRPLRVNELRDFARVFGVPLEFLLDPLPEGPARDRIIDLELSMLRPAAEEARDQLARATAALDSAAADQARAERQRARSAAKFAELEARIEFLESRQSAPAGTAEEAGS